VGRIIATQPELKVSLLTLKNNTPGSGFDSTSSFEKLRMLSAVEALTILSLSNDIPCRVVLDQIKVAVPGNPEI
jgi:hypothetical protein